MQSARSFVALSSTTRGDEKEKKELVLHLLQFKSYFEKPQFF